jgi:glycosyltransferase involved in cell wall biosynthesis
VREDFLSDVYKINRNKISLLPFGFDDSQFDISQKETIKNRIRNNYKLSEHDVVFITGGKIDRRKNIHLILEAFQLFQKQHPNNNFKLIVFGKPDSEMESIVQPLLNHPSIISTEWLTPLEISEHFIASDIALFLGTHSVLWEETLGLGIPCVFKKWDKMDYLNFANNCLFLEDITTDSILKQLSIFATNTETISELKKNASSPQHENFYYSKISKAAINLTI